MRGHRLPTSFDSFTYLLALRLVEDVNFLHLAREVHLSAMKADPPGRGLFRWHNEQVFERGRAA